MNSQATSLPLIQRIAAWLVHAITASTAVVGVYTLVAIYHQRYLLAFWLMGLAIFIDAIDGSLARLVDIKRTAARIDGALLDNIVDYLNYVITPAFLLMIHPTLLPQPWAGFIISTFVLASAYQFTQCDAKTDDHFFKGFPSYWNIVVFYLFIFNTPAWFNALLLIVLAVLVFIPIKYVYPSRLDYLSHSPVWRKAMLLASMLYGLVSVLLLWSYPDKNPFLIAYTLMYIVFYFLISGYRTWVPLAKKT